MANNVVLKLSDITMQFGGVVAVDNLNLEVRKNEVIGLIGPNGAGKTTAFNVVTGVYEPTNGAVNINGMRVIENFPHGKMAETYKGKHQGDYGQVMRLTPDRVTRLGVARTFQNIRLFKEMSVLENVLVAMHMNQKQSIFGSVFRSKTARQEEKQMIAEAEELLRKVELYENRHDLATSLPYGKQRHLEHRQQRAADTRKERGDHKRQLFVLEQVDPHRLRRDLIIADRLKCSAIGRVDQKHDQRDAKSRENNREQRRFVGREFTQNVGAVGDRSQRVPLEKCS